MTGFDPKAAIRISPRQFCKGEEVIIRSSRLKDACELCGLLPAARSVGQRVDLFEEAS